MPGLVLGRSDGVLGIPTPFHFVEIWDSTSYIVDSGDILEHTVNMPVCLPGDILLMTCCTDGDGADMQLPTESPDEDGWVHRIGPQSSGGNNAVSYTMMTKIATEEDSRSTVIVTTPATEEICCQILTLIGAAPYIDWIVGTAIGQQSTTWNWVNSKIELPNLNHWLGMLVQVNDDNRDPTPSTPDSWQRHLRALTPGGSINGLSNGIWYKEIIPVTVPEDMGPDEDMVISSDRDMEFHCLAIPPNDTGSLFLEQRAMVIQNPTFDDAIPDAWWHEIGAGNWQRNAGGSDAGFHAYAGSQSGEPILAQNIPIPSDLEAIADAGRLRCQVDYFGESAGNDDERVNLLWFDGESPENQLGNSHTSEYMGSHTEWTARSVKHCAPVGSRFLQIQCQSRRQQSTSNDGYLDQFTGTWIVDHE